MLIKSKVSQLGLSVIEILVAMSIFLIIAASITAVILGSFQSSRLAKEEDRASFLAKQGLEAVENIRNQNWANLVDGNYGLSNSGGSWSFSGSSDVTDAKYTRVILIESVQRDGNFDIVSSGGTVDNHTKKITSTVSWNFSPTRQNQISYTNYLTNWQLSTATEGNVSLSFTSCNEYCQNDGYGTGTCRASSGVCGLNDETYEEKGDVYCTGGVTADTCCCL